MQPLKKTFGGMKGLHILLLDKATIEMCSYQTILQKMVLKTQNNLKLIKVV
jgi:hypothetical protein